MWLRSPRSLFSPRSPRSCPLISPATPCCNVLSMRGCLRASQAVLSNDHQVFAVLAIRASCVTPIHLYTRPHALQVLPLIDICLIFLSPTPGSQHTQPFPRFSTHSSFSKRLLDPFWSHVLVPPGPPQAQDSLHI